MTLKCKYANAAISAYEYVPKQDDEEYETLKTYTKDAETEEFTTLLDRGQ
jgi:hypothetical protein